MIGLAIGHKSAYDFLMSPQQQHSLATLMRAGVPFAHNAVDGGAELSALRSDAAWAVLLDGAAYARTSAAFARAYLVGLWRLRELVATVAKTDPPVERFADLHVFCFLLSLAEKLGAHRRSALAINLWGDKPLPAPTRFFEMGRRDRGSEVAQEWHFEFDYTEDELRSFFDKFV